LVAFGTFTSRRSRGAILAVALLGSAALGLTGCASQASPFVGTWGSPGQAGEPSLVLGSDGSATGTDGCNQLVGKWTATSTGISFANQFAQTRMYCEGVDDWLGQASTATLSGSTLTILDASGAEIGTLDRHS